MKKNKVLRTTIILAYILLCSLSCNKDEDSGSPLEGNWTKFIEGRLCSLTVTGDNKWQAEFIGDAGTDVWGRFTISGNQITVIDEGGDYMSSSPGVYTFAVTGSSATFTVVNDPEDGRRTVIQGIWTRA
jgi:hypothetical protein